VTEAAPILVVDDDVQIRRGLRRLLSLDGHRVEEADSGMAALERLGSGEAWSLVMLDLFMPGLDGYEVLCRMQAEPDLRRIPVLMISGAGDRGAVARCIAEGATDFLIKPFELDILRARVRSSLDRKRRRDLEERYMRHLEAEDEKSEKLILSMLPQSVAQRLRDGETHVAEDVADASVLFADIAGFTARTAGMPASELVRYLDHVFSRFDALAREHGAEKIKTLGDGYVAAAGVPDLCADHPARAARLALSMVAAMKDIGDGLSLRVGLHKGPLVAGTLGRVRPAYDIWGASVNLASRMESTGAPDRVQVTSAFREALEDAFVFESRGLVEVAGFGPRHTHWLLSAR